MLAVAAQAHALFELVHVVDVLHPLGVHVAQQADALQLAHHGRAVALLLGGEDVHAPLVQQVGDVLPFQVVELVGGIVEVGGQAQPVHIMAAQRGKIPVIGAVAVEEVLAGIVNGLAHHFMQLVGDVLAVQHGLALLVDDLALLVHHIVILQDLFADGEVGRLQLFLGALDGVGDELVLDGHVLLKAQTVHEILHPLTAENAHQVVLQREEEPGRAGVALTAGTAAELVVDAAALVTLGADDEQTARVAHFPGLFFDLRLIFRAQFLKALTGGQHLGVLRVGVAVALGHQHFQLGVNGHLRRGGQLGALRLGAGLGVFVLVLHRVQVFGQRPGQLFAQLRLGHIGHVAAQHDVGAAARHVGGDGHSALFAGLRHDLRLAVMLLGVQHVVLDAALFQHFGQCFALFHADGAHQHRLTLGVALRHLVNDRLVLAVDGLVHAVRQVLPGAGLVGGHADDLQAVNFAELVRLGGGGAGHAAELFVHAEVVLEGDGGQRFALGGDGHALLGLDGLMQAVVVAASVHQAAGEFIHNDDLAVFHDVVGVPVHHAAGLDGAVNVMAQRHVVGVGQIVHLEPFLGLADAALGEGAGLVLFVHHIVAVHLILGLLLVVQLHNDALFQSLGEVVGALVHHAGILALAGDDEGSTGLVDEDGVHLVHDGVGVAPLHHVGLVDHHVVPQIVKAELVVGAVGHVRQIGLFALGRLHIVNHQPHAQTEEPVHLAHPLTVAAGQIIVDRHHMDALAGEGVEVHRHGGHQRFAFAGLHLSDAGAVQHDAADNLHGIGLQAQHTPVRLAADGKGFGQQVIQRLAVGKALLELSGFGFQLLIGQRLHLAVQRQHLVRQRFDFFQLFVGECAKEFFKKRHISTPVFLPRGRLLIAIHSTIIHPHGGCCQIRAGVFYKNVQFYALAGCFSGRLSSTSIKKMQPKPSASQRVKGLPSTKVLMRAATTGSAKLYRLAFCGPM